MGPVGSTRRSFPTFSFGRGPEACYVDLVGPSAKSSSLKLDERVFAHTPRNCSCPCSVYAQPGWFPSAGKGETTRPRAGVGCRRGPKRLAIRVCRASGSIPVIHRCLQNVSVMGSSGPEFREQGPVLLGRRPGSEMRILRFGRT